MGLPRIRKRRSVQRQRCVGQGRARVWRPQSRREKIERRSRWRTMLARPGSMWPLVGSEASIPIIQRWEGYRPPPPGHSTDHDWSSCVQMFIKECRWRHQNRVLPDCAWNCISIWQKQAPFISSTFWDWMILEIPPKVSTLLKTSLLAWEPSPDMSTHLKPDIPNLFISERERFLHDSKSAPCHQVKLLLPPAPWVHKTLRITPGWKLSVAPRSWVETQAWQTVSLDLCPWARIFFFFWSSIS